MHKKDCVFVTLDLCREPHLDYRRVLKAARIRGRKLILLTTCGALGDVFHAVRSLASENMDFPVRHYHGVDIESVVSVERCADFEVLKLDESIDT